LIVSGFFQIHDLPKPKYFSESIVDLSIGSYENIEVGYHSMPIIEALRKFVDKRISALPIVDEEGKLIDIYAKFDVIVSRRRLIFIAKTDLIYYVDKTKQR
jgi:5'-AMP-activated protein kinase regulatory gamma subunit